MEKAGLIEEMMMDAFDDAVDEEDLEAEVEDEVNKVLAELSVDIKNLPTPQTAVHSFPSASISNPVPLCRYLSPNLQRKKRRKKSHPIWRSMRCRVV